MLGKTLKVSLLVVAILTASSAYLVTVIPAGPSTRVIAEVVSRTSKSGPMGNTGVLICALEDGRQVTVDVPPIATIQTGDQVFLNTHDRYIVGPNYTFAGKRLSP